MSPVNEINNWTGGNRGLLHKASIILLLLRDQYNDPYRQMGRQQNMYGGGFGAQSPMKYPQQATSTNMAPQRQSPATSGNWGSPQGHFSQSQVNRKNIGLREKYTKSTPLNWKLP